MEYSALNGNEMRLEKKKIKVMSACEATRTLNVTISEIIKEKCQGRSMLLGQLASFNISDAAIIATL